MNIHKYKAVFFILSVVGLTLASCTKFANPSPEFEEYTQEVDTTVKRKVLVIAVDGLVGSQIKSYQPKTIGKLMERGKYSFEAKADNNTNGYASWATLLTGYPSSRHKMTDDSFMPEIDLDDPHASFETVPSIFYRLENTDRRLKTAAVVQSQTMSTMLVADADNNYVVPTDKDAEQRATGLLEEIRPDFMLVQFNGLVEAGVQGGFIVDDNSQYKQVLDEIDGYIGNIISAVEDNEQYELENWLIVIASSQGGTVDGTYGGQSPDEINTFSLYYNKSFKSLEFSANSMDFFFANGYFPGTYKHYDNEENGITRTFSTMGVRAQSPAGTDSRVFNVNATESKAMTYEFKMRLREDNVWEGLSFTGGYQYWFNYFMGKDASTGADTKGWHLYGQNLNFKLIVQDGSNTRELEFTRGTDGDWNHFAFVFKEISTTQTQVTVYLNGANIKSEILDGMGINDFANDEPLTLGFNTQRTDLGYAHYDLADFRVWNRALTEGEARTISCQKDIEGAMASDLVAYYRNFSGDTWVNSLDNGAPDLTLSGSPEVRSTKNYSTCDEPADAVYLQNIDLFPEVYYWLGLEMNEDWKMPGVEFLNNFLGEFWED